MPAAAQQQHRRRSQRLHIKNMALMLYQPRLTLAGIKQGLDTIKAKAHARRQSSLCHGGIGQGINIQMAQGVFCLAMQRNSVVAQLHQPHSPAPLTQHLSRKGKNFGLTGREHLAKHLHAAAANHVTVGRKTAHVNRYAGRNSTGKAAACGLHGAGFKQSAAHGSFKSATGLQSAGSSIARGRARAAYHGNQHGGFIGVQQVCHPCFKGVFPRGCHQCFWRARRGLAREGKGLTVAVLFSHPRPPSQSRSP